MKVKKQAAMSAGLLLMFALWTLLIQCVDVKAAGPDYSKVGFAALNVWFHGLTGVNMTLYAVTDWLGLVPVLICCCFAAEGTVQWVRRKHVLRVDADIILLGVYYLLVIAGYLFFEMVPVNYRPVLIDGRLEASYPSSTTLLVLSVMPTLKYQADRRAKNVKTRRTADAFAILFAVFMAAGRLLSGVHWATDIVGSVLLSAGLYTAYRAAVGYADERNTKRLNGEGKNGVS